MANQFDFIEDIKRQSKELETFLKNDLLEVIEVEGLNHFEESFQNEGFTDGGLVKWDKRQTTDNRGRDITRYRSSRVGKAGELNSYGRKNEGRAILTGHNTSNKLRDSLKATKITGGVEFSTDKDYAEVHNEGSDIMPKRQFMGESKELDDAVELKIDKQLDNIFDK